MPTFRFRPAILSTNVGDRVILAIFAPIVGLFTGLLSYILRIASSHQEAPSIQIVFVLVAIFTGTIAVYSLFVLVWALFTPKWMQALMLSRTRNLFFTILTLGISTVLIMVYSLLGL